ncbi:Dna2/Cas4 domain-containing protein [Halobacteriota archaeon]
MIQYLIGVNLIRVSDLRLYLSCPRQIYFISRGHELKIDRVEYVEHLLLRGLAFQFPMLVKEDRLCELGAWLDKIADELTRSIPKKKIDKAMSRIDIDKISTGLSRYLEDMGKMCLLERIMPWKVERQMDSNHLGMAGRPDKLIQIDGEIVPSLIKTGYKPGYSVWGYDRLQLTAYAMLVEEEFGVGVNHGFVEYVRFGEFRDAKIKRWDRKKVLLILDRIRKIREGVLPGKSKRAPCDHCGFVDMCNTRKSLLSKFFGE